MKGFPSVQRQQRHGIRRDFVKTPDGQHPASNALQSRWFDAGRRTMKGV
jgi:hypothetical protein